MKYLVSLLLLFAVTFAHSQEKDSSSLGDVVQTLLGQNGPKLGLLAQVDGEIHDNGSKTTTAITINLLRLYLFGDFEKKFFYNIQAELNGGYKTLDARLTYKESDHFAIDVGQFKSPFGKEWLTNDAELLFLKRSLIAQNMNPLRQRGLQMRGSFFDKRLTMTGGAFDGSGQSADEKISLFVGQINAIPIQSGDIADDFNLSLSGSAAYSNDPNDLSWISKQLDHTLLLSGYGKLSYKGYWIAIEDASVLHSGEMVHGFYVDAVGPIVKNVELCARLDYLNYFSDNAAQYFYLSYEKKYWLGVNWYPAKGVKLYFDYERSETQNTHSGYITLQYAINHKDLQ